MKCPKRYGAYDVMSRDCQLCHKGHLYQLCKLGDKKDKHLACAGWNTEAGDPSCCLCYENTFGNESNENNS